MAPAVSDGAAASSRGGVRATTVRTPETSNTRYGGRECYFSRNLVLLVGSRACNGKATMRRSKLPRLFQTVSPFGDVLPRTQPPGITSLGRSWPRYCLGLCTCVFSALCVLVRKRHRQGPSCSSRTTTAASLHLREREREHGRRGSDFESTSSFPASTQSWE